MIRTRWDALAEELAEAEKLDATPAKRESPRGTLTAAARSRFDAVIESYKAAPQRVATVVDMIVMVMHEGLSIGPVTDVSLTEEFEQYDVCAPERVALSKTKVRGTFRTARRDLILGGKDLQIAVIRDNEEPMYFAVHVVGTEWQSNGRPTRVDVVGYRVS